MPATDLPNNLAKPAQRALANAGITRLAQLAKKSENEVLDLHGMGPKAMTQLRQALAERGLSFRSARSVTSGRAGKQTASDSPSGSSIMPANDGPAAIDAYLATLPADQRTVLQKLRETIRSVAPNATEKINYGIPMFVLGRGLMGFNAAGAHCTLQVMSPAVVEAHAAELKGYRTGKGSIQFTPDKPIPTALIKKLVKVRLAENERLSKKPARG
ncbi:MAG TPA: DUF1801 domain-containing protein [Chloroflexota bacterium]|nr:DUF1801 domain-containing protein [Chloroflexota bacterium]